MTNRGEFLRGIKSRFKKETQLTASINKLVLQSELFNSHDIHGHDIGSAVQASLLSNKSALASRISSSQGRSASTAGSPTKTPGGRNLSLTPPLSPMDTPQGDKRARKEFLTKEGASTPRGLTGLRGKGPSSIHPQPAPSGMLGGSDGSLALTSPSSPRSGTTALSLTGASRPPVKISRLSVSERELMARVDKVLNYKTIYYDSDEDRYDAVNHKLNERSLRRRMVEVLTHKSSRDVHKEIKKQRVSEKLGWKHNYRHDLDQADDPYVSSSEEERLVKDLIFLEASHKGHLRRHRSSDDLLQMSEASKLIKYAVPLAQRNAFMPFAHYPNGLPSVLEQKAALAVLYKKRLSTSTTMSGPAFRKLVSDAKTDDEISGSTLDTLSTSRKGNAVAAFRTDAANAGGAGAGAGSGKFKGLMKSMRRHMLR